MRNYVKVAAGQTTAQISSAGPPEDGPRGVDFCEHVIVTAASTAAPGSVTLFDGTTSLFVHAFSAATASELCQVVPVRVTAKSTKGFNVTTGTSVSCVVVGHFR
jgi:hypothetical protein